MEFKDLARSLLILTIVKHLGEVKMVRVRAWKLLRCYCCSYFASKRTKGQGEEWRREEGEGGLNDRAGG